MLVVEGTYLSIALVHLDQSQTMSKLMEDSVLMTKSQVVGQEVELFSTMSPSVATIILLLVVERMLSALLITTELQELFISTTLSN